jgi:uncharacterized metal-binding protein
MTYLQRWGCVDVWVMYKYPTFVKHRTRLSSCRPAPGTLAVPYVISFVVHVAVLWDRQIVVE